MNELYRFVKKTQKLIYQNIIIIIINKTSNELVGQQHITVTLQHVIIHAIPVIIIFLLKWVKIIREIERIYIINCN